MFSGTLSTKFFKTFLKELFQQTFCSNECSHFLKQSGEQAVIFIFESVTYLFLLRDIAVLHCTHLNLCTVAENRGGGVGGGGGGGLRISLQIYMHAGMLCNIEIPLQQGRGSPYLFLSFLPPRRLKVGRLRLLKTHTLN